MRGGSGDIKDIGVCGGSGIGCRGARRESGGEAIVPRGDSGGEDRYMLVPSRGSLGGGELTGRSTGRGLTGNPGLSGNGDIKLRSDIESPWLVGRLKTPASESGDNSRPCRAAVDSSGANALIDGDNGPGCTTGRASVLAALAADLDPDLDDLSFFE